MDLSVAEIKKDKGAASDIELAKAKQKYYDALNSSDIAKRELKSAETRVKMFVANVPDALPEPVVIDPAKLSYLTHANYITAQNKINEADRIVAISSGPDTTAIDKVNRERDLQNVKDAMGDVEKTLRDGLDAAKRNYINAQDSYQLTQDRLVLARKDLNTSKERFNAGAISKLALQSYISAEVDSQLSVEQAKVSLWLAGVALLKASGGAGK
jgi:outer membrane protein TolC